MLQPLIKELQSKYELPDTEELENGLRFLLGLSLRFSSDNGGVRKGLERLLETNKDPTVRKLYNARLKNPKLYENIMQTSLAIIYGIESFKLNQTFFRDDLSKILALYESDYSHATWPISNFDKIYGKEFAFVEFVEVEGPTYYVLQEDVDKVLKCGFVKGKKYSLNDLKDEITIGSEDEHGLRYFTKMNRDLSKDEILKSKIHIAIIDTTYDFNKSQESRENNASGYSNNDAIELLKKYEEDVKRKTNRDKNMGVTIFNIHRYRVLVISAGAICSGDKADIYADTNLDSTGRFVVAEGDVKKPTLEQVQKITNSTVATQIHKELGKKAGLFNFDKLKREIYQLVAVRYKPFYFFNTNKSNRH